MRLIITLIAASVFLTHAQILGNAAIIGNLTAVNVTNPIVAAPSPATPVRFIQPVKPVGIAIQPQPILPQTMKFAPALPFATSMAPSNMGFATRGPSNIGFAVGGARGVDNFRRNVEEDFLPLPQDLTYEGIFNDYYFDTTNYNATSATCEQLFCPAYSAAFTPDPLYPLSQNELYLAVGLDSGLAKTDFGRKNLNLVVVVDVSGSMNSPFDQYAYDGKDDERNDWRLTKMEVANQAVVDMLKHLKEGDRLSIVTFQSRANLKLELTLFEDLNVGKLQEEIGGFSAGGGTNMEVGYNMATTQLTRCSECMEGGLEVYENRIIMITDAQPNTGSISSNTLAGLLQKNAKDDIFTTVIGVGLDFNSELIEIMTKTRGANYYNVYSPADFRKKMDEEFDFMVTPLVFDLKLEIDPKSFDEGEGWQVIKVYGSPNIDGGLTQNGSFIEINTLFPTPRTEEGIKGGVVLLKMFKPKSDVPLELKVSYQDRDTLTYQESTSIVDVFDDLSDAEFYGSSGVQKAVLLSRYVDLLRGWLIDQREFANEDESEDPIIVPPIFCEYYPLERKITFQDGCNVPIWVQAKERILPIFDIIINENLGRWERTSLPLKVNKEQGMVFSEFLGYMNNTITSLQDEDLDQEVDILQKLIEISV